MSTEEKFFHPGAENGELMARSGSPGGGTLCFHPGDEEGASMTRLADDLAADLHLALTSIDDRQLALLA
ncbi:hypothetical protein F4558_002452 [Micromonospora profundi]|uniref:hypothetical protein n=1 Tax=Micromonospora TaxID=1873 RepID=UPI0006AFD83E|nr:MULTISPECIES: hypothetical protein [Micromonospora]KOX11691.1 hypothetical protein ADK66_05665 [Micromonospora sp. NRRL B-16802]NJC12626.1 hypothetical protein [Micromonospora profundi]